MWIPKSEFEVLTGKAGKYDAIVASILKSNTEMKAEDVTPEFVQEVIEASDNVKVDDKLSTKVEDLNSKIETLNGTVTTVTKERDDFKSELDTVKSENEKLRDLPGAESVVDTTAKPKAEVTAVVGNETLEYAKNHKDDFAGIAAKLKADGLV